MSNDNVWVTFGDADINIIQTDEGIVVDVYSVHQERHGGPLDSAWVLDTDLGRGSTWIESLTNDERYGPYVDELEASEEMDEMALSDSDWKIVVRDRVDNEA